MGDIFRRFHDKGKVIKLAAYIALTFDEIFQCGDIFKNRLDVATSLDSHIGQQQHFSYFFICR